MDRIGNNPSHLEGWGVFSCPVAGYTFSSSHACQAPFPTSHATLLCFHSLCSMAFTKGGRARSIGLSPSPAESAESCELGRSACAQFF